LLAAVVAVCGFLPHQAQAQSAPADAEEGAKISKIECAQAFEQSQRLRNSFRYLEASAEALRCASLQCGAALSEECGRLYSDLQAATPSIVLAARTQDGKELDNVIVSIDGGARSAMVDGTPLLLDPGNHEFTFTADGFEPLKQAAVISAGERYRRVVGVLTKPESAAASTPSPAQDRRGSRTIPIASYALGGVAVAGFAGFVGFRIAGANDYEALSDTCKPTCAQSSIDAARQKYVLSYVGLAVGAAAGIAAVTVYLLSPGKPASQAATLQLGSLPSGVGAHLTKSF